MVLTHDPFVPTPINKRFEDFDSKSKINDPKYFGEMVSYMDMIVGRIVNKTDELGIRENTLILFVGDNGTDRDVSSMVNGTLLKGNKGYTTDAGTHVPLIANWKGKIAPKSVNDNLIDFTDFLPTLLECSGLEKSKIISLDGLSFYGQLLGDNSISRDWIFCHYNPNWGNFQARRYVQNKKWKLYDNGELYDLEQDKLENNPLDFTNVSTGTKSILGKFKRVLKKYN